MAKLITPVCEFGRPAKDFLLPGTDGKQWSLRKVRGATGLLVMFICNHSPYVQSIRTQLVKDAAQLQAMGVGVVAINANDPDACPEDSFARMKVVARQYSFNFPYLFDKTQEVARNYGAVCTPDFFGFNASMELQYRGRLDASNGKTPSEDFPRELINAMRQIIASGKGPYQQRPNVGCSIKWREPVMAY